MSFELSLFLINLIDVCTTTTHVEIGSWCLAAIFFLLARVFLWWTRGDGCPSDLVLKSGGPIAFDSRSRVSSLVQDLL